jgi:hypothetical protein
MATNPDTETTLPVLRRMLEDPDKDFEKMAAHAMSVQFPKEAKAAGVYERFPELRSQGDGGNKTNQPAGK